MSEIVRCIWKYGMDNGVNVVEMPEGAEILGVEQQQGLPVMYAIVEPRKPKVKRSFRFIPTGIAQVPWSGKYIGTVMFNEDRLVYHLFEIQQ